MSGTTTGSVNGGNRQALCWVLRRKPLDFSFLSAAEKPLSFEDLPPTDQAVNFVFHELSLRAPNIGNGRNPASRALFRKKELTEF